MAQQSMSFSFDPISSVMTAMSATFIGVVTTWFMAKKKYNVDKIDSANANANVSAIDQWQTIVTDLRVDMRATIEQKDKQIARLELRNEELTTRNTNLFEQNQKLTGEISGLKYEVQQLTSEVQQLNKKIGGVL